MDRVLRFLFIFILSYTVLILFFWPEKEKSKELFISVEKDFSVWELVKINFHNNTEKEVIFTNSCPNFEVFQNKNWEKIVKNEKENEKKCENFSLKAWEINNFSFWKENLKIFSEIWDYKIILKTKSWKIYEKSFEITKVWFWTNFWNAFLYKPIYNVLISLIQYWPWYSLAFWIIMLTILIKLILLWPNHKALVNQKKLQKVQPELQKIKEKYKWDHQKIAQETMELWKKRKVSPAGSCLPLLIQFPILIVIFFIVRDGMTESDSYLIYSFVTNFDFSQINNSLFWLFDLTHSGNYFISLFVWVSQFLQLHLTFKNQKTPQMWAGMMADQMAIMWKMMKYVLPVLITIFTFTMPAWVWIYWWVSTVFAILQQLVVNNFWWNDWENSTWWKKSKKKDFVDAEVVKVVKKKWWITTIKA